MKKFLLSLVAVVASLLAAPAAHAGFLYVDVFDGTNTLTVIDNGVGDDDPTLNSININTALVTFFSTQLATGSNVTSSSNQLTALADGFSRLVTSYTLTGKTGVTSDFTITSGQTGFTVPGDPKQVNTFTSVTYTNGSNASNLTSQGSIGSSNGASTDFDTVIGPINSSAAPVSGGFGVGDGFVFNNSNNPYSMQNVIDAHLVSTKTSKTPGSGIGTIQGSTTNIVVPGPVVPEPSTIVMLATLAGPLALVAARRRQRAAK